MFERTTSYDAAYVGEFPCFEESAGPAIRWAADRVRQHGGELTIVAPSRRHFRDHQILAELSARVDTQTPQTLGRFARTKPVVVSFWPNAKDLEQLDGADKMKALVVIPWLEEDIISWRAARRAVDLLGNVPIPDPPTIGDPVVEAAMRSLTMMVNLSTGLGHPRDRSMAIHAFKILKRNRHPYDPADIRAWAMANGWAADDARELSEYAAGVLAGKAYKAGPSGWTAQIIRIWRKEAAS